MKNRLFIHMIVLCLLSPGLAGIVGSTGTARAETDASTTTTQDPSVRVEAVGTSEWHLYDPEDQFVGILKSSQRQNFTLYDAGGTFIGTIRDSRAWFHRLYRKRNTRVTPEEARLYLLALEAIGQIVP